MIRKLAFGLTCALALGAFGAVPASAACAPYLCFVDLGSGGGFICPNTSVYTVLQSHLTVLTNANPTCDPNQWDAVVVKVDIPDECSGVTIWAEYSGEPDGLTLDIGDSPTNDGFGGDSGSLPAGQNAEVQVFDEKLSVYNAAVSPANAKELLASQLSLKDGAVNVVVKDQFVSVGQPYQALGTPNLNSLFFLPANPQAPANRTIYVGMNRAIDPIGGQDTVSNGCGARRVFMTLN